MKKLFILMIVVAGAMTSCTKAYTCSCDAKTASMTTPVNANYTFTDTKSNAKKQCENWEDSQSQPYKQQGGTYTCKFN